MAITINGITCEEIVAGFSEQVDITQGPSARKGFLCDWADRYAVAQGLLGLASATSIGGSITLLAPAQYPEIPTTFCRTVEIQPVGSPTQGPIQLQYPKCIVWANYTTMPWTFQAFTQLNAANPFTFAEQSISSSVEWITIPGIATRWAGTTRSTGQDYGIRVALVDLQITIHFMPYLPTAQAYLYTGLINNAVYLGAATGQLLYNGCQSRQGAVSDGTFTQDVTYSFTWRSVRWDYAYDAVTGTWKQVTGTDGSTPFISSVDFSQIIPTYYHY